MSNGEAADAADTQIPTSTNPLRKILAPVQKPQPPAPPKPTNPLRSILADQSAANPLRKILAGQPDTLEEHVARARTLATSEPSFDEEHPVIGAVKNMIVDTVKDLATTIKYSLIASPGGPGSAMGEANMSLYVARLSPEQAQEDQARLIRGSALIASSVVGGVVRGIPLAAKVLGKWGSFLTGEFLGGATYGGIRPLDEDESRTQAILGDGAQFAAIGGATDLAAAGFKRYILKLPAPARTAALNSVKQEFDQLDAQLASGGVSKDDLPPEQVAAIEEPILRRAIKKVQPTVDLDQVVAKETDRPSLHIEPSPGERTLDLPEPKFGDELARLEPHARPAERVRGQLALRSLGPIIHFQAEPLSEYVEGPVVRGHSGKIYATGSSHPEIIANEVDKGVPTSEFEGIHAESPNRGFRTNLRPFISRNQAADIVGQSDKLFSEDLKGKRLTTYQNNGYAELQAHDVADKIIRPSTMPRGPRHGTEVDNAVSIIRQGLRPGSSVSLSGRDFEGYPVTLEFKGVGATKATYESPLGPSAHPGAATTTRSAKDIQRVFFDTGDFISREDAESAYRQLRQALDDSGRKDIPIEAAKFNEEKETYSYGGQVSFEGIQDYANYVKGLGDSQIWRESNDVIDTLDRADQAGDKALTEKYSRRADIVSQEMGRRGLLEVPPEVHSLALGQAAVDKAVAETPIRWISAPEVQDAQNLVVEVTSDPIGPGSDPKAVSRIMDSALAPEKTAAEERVVLRMTEPGPRELDLEKRASVKDRAEVRKQMKRALDRDYPIKVSPAEQTYAEGREPPESETLVNPKKMDGLEIAAHLNESQLDEIANSLKRLARSQAGAAAPRLILTIAGSGMEWLSTDDHLSEGEKIGLRAVGAMLIAAGVGPRISEWAKKSDWMRHMTSLWNPGKAMADPNGTELFRQYQEAMTGAKFKAADHAKYVRLAFPDAESHRAASLVMDEGQSAPEFHTLSPAQQREAMAMNQLNLRLGLALKTLKRLTAFQNSFVKNILPEATYDQWKALGWKMLGSKRTRIYGLRELEQWAKSRGLEGPLMDPALGYSAHWVSAHRIVGVVRLGTELERLGLIEDVKKGAQTLPNGWRAINLPSMAGKMAPDEVAQGLENIARPAPKGEVLNALDKIKGVWMRSIMVWWWTHGLNVLRGRLAMLGSDYSFAWARQAFKRGDPIAMEAASHGVDLVSRPDYGKTIATSFEKLMGKIGMGSFGGRVDRFFEMQHRLLWEDIVPSFQVFAYANKMKSWVDQMDGKFLPGTAEYKAAARRAADFANTVAGRIPQELVNPELARGMRLLMFSPQWTMTRIGLIAHAAGEIGDIAEGKLNPRHAMYLPFKMQQLAMGTAITIAGSYILSGKRPAFNPSTSKFYMQTGLRGAGGKELGVDILGWWQNDIDIFSHPFDYVLNRLNPSFKVAYETLSGRDYLGRSMTTGQTIGDIVSSLGPPVEIANAVTRGFQAVTGGRPVSEGEAAQLGLRASTLGNVATLPRPIDVAVARVAKKILNNTGIPDNSDNIYELSRMLRANLLRGQPLVSSQVITYLAMRRRGVVTKPPGGAAYGALWQHARSVFNDIF